MHWIRWQSLRLPGTQAAMDDWECNRWFSLFNCEAETHCPLILHNEGITTSHSSVNTGRANRFCPTSERMAEKVKLLRPCYLGYRTLPVALKSLRSSSARSDAWRLNLLSFHQTAHRYEISGTQPLVTTVTYAFVHTERIITLAHLCPEGMLLDKSEESGNHYAWFLCAQKGPEAVVHN